MALHRLIVVRVSRCEPIPSLQLLHRMPERSPGWGEHPVLWCRSSPKSFAPGILHLGNGTGSDVRPGSRVAETVSLVVLQRCATKLIDLCGDLVARRSPFAWLFAEASARVASSSDGSHRRQQWTSPGKPTIWTSRPVSEIAELGAFVGKPIRYAGAAGSQGLERLQHSPHFLGPSVSSGRVFRLIFSMETDTCRFPSLSRVAPALLQSASTSRRLCWTCTTLA